MKILITLLFAALFIQQADAKNLCLGTFSSFSYNSEGGDLLGVEIKIVYTRLGTQAAIQISQGEPGPLLVVPVVCDGKHISLNIPEQNGQEAAHFEGTVTKDSLYGELVYKGGGSEKLKLARKKGYWDK